MVPQGCAAPGGISEDRTGSGSSYRAEMRYVTRLLAIIGAAAIAVVGFAATRDISDEDLRKAFR
jgi:hypothetical protein